jgi:predicted O-methyltransferase YrrM
MRVFEYGSGGSTLFFGERAKVLVSVEHDREWYKVLKQHLEKRGLRNVEYLLAEPEVAESASSERA